MTQFSEMNKEFWKLNFKIVIAVGVLNLFSSVGLCFISMCFQFYFVAISMYCIRSHIEQYQVIIVYFIFQIQGCARRLVQAQWSMTSPSVSCICLVSINNWKYRLSRNYVGAISFKVQLVLLFTSSIISIDMDVGGIISFLGWEHTG